MKIVRTVFGFVVGRPVEALLLAAAMYGFGASAFYSAKLRTTERQLVEVQLDGMNQTAMNATVQTYLRDSLARVSERLVVQVRPKADTAMTAQIVARVADVSDTVPARFPHGDGRFIPMDASDTTEQVYEFPFVLYPFHGLSKVSVWPQEGRARAHITVGVAPARFRAAVTCGPATPPAGLRFAKYSLQGPPWLLIDSVQVQQDPVVCNAPVLMTPRKRALGGWVIPMSAAVGATTAAAYGRNPWRGLAIGGAIGAGVQLIVRAVVR